MGAAMASSRFETRRTDVRACESRSRSCSKMRAMSSELRQFKEKLGEGVVLVEVSIQMEGLGELNEKQDRLGGTEYDRVMGGRETNNSVVESIIRQTSLVRVEGAGKMCLAKRKSIRNCDLLLKK
jgi:hypothetical protein